jgi:hypothetical protein
MPQVLSACSSIFRTADNRFLHWNRYLRDGNLLLSSSRNKGKVLEVSESVSNRTGGAANTNFFVWVTWFSSTSPASKTFIYIHVFPHLNALANQASCLHSVATFMPVLGALDLSERLHSDSGAWRFTYSISWTPSLRICYLEVCALSASGRRHSGPGAWEIAHPIFLDVSIQNSMKNLLIQLSYQELHGNLDFRLFRWGRSHSLHCPVWGHPHHRERVRTVRFISRERRTPRQGGAESSRGEGLLRREGFARWALTANNMLKAEKCKAKQILGCHFFFIKSRLLTRKETGT